MKTLRALAAAFSYFTIFPAPSFARAPDVDAIRWLPLVGAVIGAIAGFAGYGVDVLTKQPFDGAIAAWSVAIVLTGAIHVDGFLDACDGLLAAVPPERRLEIMDDPRHGTYAIAGMAIVTLAWIAALAHVPPPAMPAILTIAAASSRFAGISLTQYPHARTGASYPLGFFVYVQLFALIAVTEWYLGRPGLGFAVIAGAIGVAQLIGRLAARRLGGGLTGDVYGAVIVITEVLALMALDAIRR